MHTYIHTYLVWHHSPVVTQQISAEPKACIYMYIYMYIYIYIHIYTHIYIVWHHSPVVLSKSLQSPKHKSVLMHVYWYMCMPADAYACLLIHMHSRFLQSKKRRDSLCICEYKYSCIKLAWILIYMHIKHTYIHVTCHFLLLCHMMSRYARTRLCVCVCAYIQICMHACMHAYKPACVRT